LEDAETGEQIEINTQIARRELFLQISSLDSKRSFHARSGGTMLIRLRCKPAELSAGAALVF